jgi:hypothetical protein
MQSKEIGWKGGGLDLSDLAHGSVAALANTIITFGFYIMNESL